MVPTIRDVSKKAEVSIATVSRVLNNLPGYSEETKQKVLTAIQELGYQPNEIARGLVNKKTQTIGVLFPTVSSMFSSAVLSGIEEMASDRGYSVFVCNTDQNGKRTLDYLQALREKRVDGIIFTSDLMKEEYYRYIDSVQLPTVLLSTESFRYPLPFVKVDDKRAAYMATQYLLEKGHRFIGMISGTESDPVAGTPRVEGYLQALKDYGCIFKQKYVVYGDFGYESGIAAMEQLLDAVGNELTAVFVASDEMAAGAIRVAHRYGIRIPEQLSIIGYDDLQIAQMVTPPLTTVSQPLVHMGRLAAEMLLETIETGNKVESRIVPCSITERESVRVLK